MSNVFQVEWILTPKISPQPKLNCHGCGRIEAFKSTGKIRLNANGKRLDAWAIYKCVACDNTWNRPVFARRNISDIEPLILRAMQTNDEAFVNALAFDIAQLRRFANDIVEFPDVNVRKLLRSDDGAPYSALEIWLRVKLPVSLRADRLLATELDMSRTRIQQLEQQGHITITPERKDGLRRRVQDGMKISIDVLNDANSLKIITRATAK